MFLMLDNKTIDAKQASEMALPSEQPPTKSTQAGEVYEFRKDGFSDKTFGSLCGPASLLMELQLDLTLGTLGVSGLSRRILEVYSEACENVGISRICLTHNPTFSRKLIIVSTANLDSSGLEELVPGYSCFVATNSSLFPRGNGNVNGIVRTYSDIENIVDSFRVAQKPVQRTIRKLYNSGIRSGLSLSLDFGIHGGCILFMNSKKRAAFDNWNHDDQLSINVLRMVVYSALHSFLEDGCGSQLPQRITIDKGLVNSVFAAPQFATRLEREIERNLGLRLSVDHKNHVEQPFFVPTQTVLFLATAILQNLDRVSAGAPVKLSIDIKHGHRTNQVFFEFRGILSIDAQATCSSLERIARRSDIEISLCEDGFNLSVPCAPANRLEILNDYSVS